MARVAARGAGSGRVRAWGPGGGQVRDNRRPRVVHDGGHAARTGPRRSLRTIPAGARVLRARFFVYTLLALLALVPSAHAQSFGKNKVHYEQLQWSVLETDRKSTPSELQSRLHLVCRLLLEKK